MSEDLPFFTVIETTVKCPCSDACYFNQFVANFWCLNSCILMVLIFRIATFHHSGMVLEKVMVEIVECSKIALVCLQCPLQQQISHLFLSATCLSFGSCGNYRTMSRAAGTLSSGVPQVITSTAW